MSLLTEQADEKVRICIFLTREEFSNIDQIARYMGKEHIIPRATVAAFVKASTYKFYNEFNEQLKRSQNANR